MNDSCEPLTKPTHDEGSAMSIWPQSCPNGLNKASGQPSWSRTRPLTVDSGPKQATGTWVSGGGRYTHARKARRADPGSDGGIGNQLVEDR